MAVALSLAGQVVRFGHVAEEAARGDLIGAYRVVAPLEAGGMASLYLAHRPPETNIVALKVIQNQLREVSRIVRMFEDEVRTLRHIEHANVVRVLDAGEYAGGRFLVMEYVHGCSLARLVDEIDHRGLELPVSVAVHVAVEIALALHAAHEAVDEEGRPLNVVHRDVSPQNVMISETGAVKLIDFGIAQATGRKEVTNASLLKGKLRYMAPEQASGSALDRRTDLFALGIVIWEMLTGKRFAAARTRDVFARLLDPKATPPSEDNADVGAELDALVLSSLSRDPEDRPATGLALAEGLRACTDVSDGRDGLRALVNKMFSAELEYTRHWIAESFELHDETTLDGAPVFDDSRTKKVSREALFACAAQKLTSDALELLDSEERASPKEPLPVTKSLRAPKSGLVGRPRLDLTFTLLQSQGPESTGARPIVSLFGASDAAPDPALGPGFDETDATDQLAIHCLANLRKATWARRPAGSPPSLSVIQSLDLEPPQAASPVTPEIEGSGRWPFLLIGVAFVGVGLALSWLLFH